MTKIAFITPSSGNSGRGVGFYSQRLLTALRQLKEADGYQFIETSNPVGNFDLIHYPFFDLFSHTLPGSHSCPVIVTVHDAVPLEFPEHYPPGLKGTLNFQLQKLALSRVHRVITDSYASLRAIHFFLSVPHRKLRLVYLAPDPVYKPLPKNITTPVKAKYNLPDKFVLYVGDINWNKNLPGLVRACLGLNLSLVLVGSSAAKIDSLDLSHPELSHLKNFVPELHHPLIHRLGFVPDADLAAIYNLASVYCQPSFAEGFGLPVLEAMACGTPIACSQTHSLPEIAGNAALYFDPRQTPQISGSIKDILDHPALQKKLVSAGTNQVLKFSWAKTAAQTLLAYHEI